MALPLVVQVGGVSHVFEDAFTVGRRGTDLLLDDPYVSPVHAVFRPAGGKWVCMDAGSTNGTWLGGVAKVYAPVEIGRGTQIRIGHTVLTCVPC